MKKRAKEMARRALLDNRLTAIQTHSAACHVLENYFRCVAGMASIPFDLVRQTPEMAITEPDYDAGVSLTISLRT